MRGRYLGMLAATAAAVPLGLPAAAQAITGLTLQSCFGGAAGCVNVAGNPLQHATSVAVSRNGSVYVTGHAGTAVTVGPGFVSHFFPGKGSAISYDGCVTDTADGGLCTAETALPLAFGDASSVAVSPNGRSIYLLNDYGVVNHLFANASRGELTYDGCVTYDGSGGRCAPGVTFGSGDPFKNATGLFGEPVGLRGHRLRVLPLGP